MIARSGTPRFELAGGRIRARYGHSRPEVAAPAPAPPPVLLYHGTSPAAAARILAEGLRPMRRRYVHLAVDPATARRVGARHAKEPRLLGVRAAAAAAAGVRFFPAVPGIWLADPVPPAFIEPVAVGDDGGAQAG